jgi:hypothetical protein
MRLFHALTAGALLIAGGSGAATAKKWENPEAELAAELEGRIPGKPVHCIPLHRVRSSRIIERTAIVYDAGTTIYVNRPANADTLDHWDTMVITPTASQLCSVDIVRLIDSSLRSTTGFVSLREFVPYKRAEARQSR